jgi:hypothetical protein
MDKFKNSNVALDGIPEDISTSFGRGTYRGPKAARLRSVRLIEKTFEQKPGNSWHSNK